MAEIHRLPDRDEIEREAGDWIARLNADDVTDQDRANFETWRKASPRNARAYEELSATWRHFTEAGHLVRAVTLGQVLHASTQQAMRQSTATSAVKRVDRNLRFLAAATLAAFLIGGAWLFLNQPPRTLFQTAIGEHATIELPDGSSLELNSNSRARIDYTPRARVIRLERGEAFFEVQHDAARPFWVVAGGSWVRAVGTAFNVHVLPTGVRVIVSEGTVKVAGSAPSNIETPSDLQLSRASVSILKAGQEIDVHGTTREVRSLPPIEITRSVSWRTGTVYFESERLGNVVDELGRYSTLRVVIEDDALGDLQVGGTFQASEQGTEALLTTLQDGFGLEVWRTGRTAHVKSKEEH